MCIARALVITTVSLNDLKVLREVLEENCSSYFLRDFLQEESAWLGVVFDCVHVLEVRPGVHARCSPAVCVCCAHLFPRTGDCVCQELLRLLRTLLPDTTQFHRVAGRRGGWHLFERGLLEDAGPLWMRHVHCP